MQSGCEKDLLGNQKSVPFFLKGEKKDLCRVTSRKTNTEISLELFLRQEHVAESVFCFFF